MITTCGLWKRITFWSLLLLIMLPVMFDKMIGGESIVVVERSPKAAISRRRAAVSGKNLEMVQTCTLLALAEGPGRKSCEDKEQEWMQMQKIRCFVTILGARLKIEVQCFCPQPQCSGSTHVKVEIHDRTRHICIILNKHHATCFKQRPQMLKTIIAGFHATQVIVR